MTWKLLSTVEFPKLGVALRLYKNDVALGFKIARGDTEYPTSGPIEPTGGSLSPKDDELLRKILAFDLNLAPEDQDQVLRTVLSSEFIKPGKQKADDAVIDLAQLSDVENPSFTGSKVRVQGVVSGSSATYLVPAFIALKTSETKKIEIADPLCLQLLGVSRGAQLRQLEQELGSQVANVTEWRTVYKVRARPPVFTLEQRGEKIFTETGNEYRPIDLFITSDRKLSFKPGDNIEFEGIPTPNPKNQAVTLLVYSTRQTSQTTTFDPSKVRELKARLATFNAVDEKMEWILTNVERFTRVKGRRNIAILELLTHFTPIWVRYEGEFQRGWGITATVGDSTVGKSETARKLITLFRAGTLITAETASVVGLTGTTVQLEREGWFTDWGMLPLCHKKILKVDAAQKLPHKEWATLAEAQRTGVIQLTKASRDTAYAQTRQYLIANPVEEGADKYTVKPLSEFLYPIQSLASVFDKTSIARFDAVVFADTRDVSPDDVNSELHDAHEPLVENLGDLLRVCWGDTAELQFDPEAWKQLLASATDMYRKFGCSAIPLVSIDMKWKLARLSAAVAFLTASLSDDLARVVVTKEHVGYIVHFLEKEYTRANLHTFAQQTRTEQMDWNEAQGIVLRIVLAVWKEDRDEYRTKVLGVVRYVALEGNVTRDAIAAKFDLSDKYELRPLIANLEIEGLIRRRRAFSPTTKATELVKLLGGSA